MITVHTLRKAGNKVRLEHRRRYFDTVNKRWSFLTKWERDLSNLPKSVEVDAKGGITNLILTTRDGVTIETSAECSKKEAFDRKRGVAIALGRALNLVAGKTICLP